MIQKKLENVEYFSSEASIITNDARCTLAIKPRIVIAKSAFNKKTVFTSKLDWNLREKSIIALYGAET